MATRKRGNKTKYTQELADEIIERLSSGEMLRQICKDDHMPAHPTVCGWASDNLYGFGDRYARARKVGYDVLAEELLDIADTPVEGIRRELSKDGEKIICDDMLGHRKLQVDARKWLLSKCSPDKYGEKQAIEHSGSVDIAQTILAARKRSGG